MAYRPALHGPKGDWGRFLDQMRRERDWSAVQAWENLHGLLGLSPKSVAVYKALESGTRNVAPEEAEALRAYFGGGPEGHPEFADPMVTALTAQTEAIGALVDELRSWRTEDRGRLSELEASVRTLVAGVLGEPGNAAGATPRVLPETTE
jgi:hypothetical protein